MMPAASVQAAFDRYLDRESWLAARRLGICSSDAAAVLGESPWQSQWGLWAEKTGQIPPSKEQNKRFEAGRFFEPFIAQWFEEATGLHVIDPGQFTIHRSATHPVMLATCDRLIVGENVAQDAVLEIKTGNSFDAAEWRRVGPPRHYQIQLQHQLAVTGIERGWIVLMVGLGDDLLPFEVERNEEDISRLQTECTRFWDEHVVSKVPPPVDGSISTTKALRAVYPDESGETIAIPGDALRLDAEYVAAEIALHAAQERMRQAQNQMIAAVGTASTGTVPNGATYSYRVLNRAGFTVAPTSFRVLKRHDP